MPEPFLRGTRFWFRSPIRRRSATGEFNTAFDSIDSVRLAARAATAVVFLLWSGGCGPSPAEQALEAAAPAEYAAWRAAELATEAARWKVEPAELEKRHQAGEQLAVLEPQAEQLIRESSALARAAEAAAAYSDAMWAAENARLRVVNARDHEVLNQSGHYVEKLDRLIVATEVWAETYETILTDISIPKLLNPFEFQAADMDKLIEALNRQEAVRRRTAPGMTGPEAQAAAQEVVDVLVALTNEALAQTESVATARDAAREAWEAVGSDAVLIFEASELAGQEAMDRLKMAAPAAWAAFEAVTTSTR